MDGSLDAPDYHVGGRGPDPASGLPPFLSLPSRSNAVFREFLLFADAFFHNVGRISGIF